LTIVVHIKYLHEWRAGGGFAMNRSMWSNPTIYNSRIIMYNRPTNAIKLCNIKGVNFSPCPPPTANAYDIAPPELKVYIKSNQTILFQQNSINAHNKSVVMFWLKYGVQRSINNIRCTRVQLSDRSPTNLLLVCSHNCTHHYSFS